MKLYLPIILIAFAFASCTSSQKIVYFDEAANASYSSSNAVPEYHIKPNDILSINISSLNAEASEAFNPHAKNTVSSTTATGSRTEPGGYLVSTEGTISLPFLGKLEVAGMTKRELKDTITSMILTKKLLVEPLVEIRYLNYEVSVLGEVARPTVITVPSERISLLKALGLAGDLTIYGQRENVLLIREENGKKITRKIDLTSPEFFKSPYYYLEPNDVVYVAPNKNKIRQATTNTTLIPIVLSGLSLAIIAVDRLLR